MPTDLSHALSISTLGTAGIAVATFIVLGLALLTSLVDRRFGCPDLEVQEEKLQQSEAYLSEAQRLSHTGSFGWRASTGEILWSEETFRIFQYDKNDETDRGAYSPTCSSGKTQSSCNRPSSALRRMGRILILNIAC